MNLDEGSFNVCATLDAPEGYNGTVSPESAEFTPPSDPLDADCTDPQNFTITFVAPQGILGNDTLQFIMSLGPDEAHGVGTYAPPEEESHTLYVTTAASTDDLDEEDDDEDTEPTPVPGAVIVVLAVLGLVALRRLR